MAAVSVALGLLGGCGSGRSEAERTADLRAAQARQLAKDAGLPADVTAFLETAARGVAATFTATYHVGDATVVVAQRPPRRRVDTRRAGAPDHADVVTADATYACDRDPRWSCRRTGPVAQGAGAFNPELVTTVAQSLAASRDAYSLRAEPREVAGVEADCLVASPRASDDTAAPGGAETLCVSPSGVPLLLAAAGGEALRATAFRRGASDAALALPATP
ncbi:MAG TPA: hypothetical protein VHN98_04700 [Acidimicrobiales bacterium]|nr:hypothetical protein [Acidimicrobiales bacterium]